MDAGAWEKGVARPCPCGHERYRCVSRGVYRRSFPENYEFALWQCENCGLVRTLPVPDPTIYAGLDFEGDQACAREWLEAAGSDVSAAIRRHAPSASQVLDVGCNTGELVEALARRGWDAAGCDIDRRAVAHARKRGLPVFFANPEDAPPAGVYDAVTCIHTLEHVLEPVPFLRNIATALRPGGVLHIRVPNYGGALPRLMADNWGFLVPYQHVWQFTPTTLQRLVASSGPFEAVHISARTQLEPPSDGVRGVVKGLVGVGSRLLGRGDEIKASFRRPG